MAGTQLCRGSRDVSVERLNGDGQRSDQIVDNKVRVAACTQRSDQSLGVTGGWEDDLDRVTKHQRNGFSCSFVVRISSIKKGNHDAGVEDYDLHSSRSSSRYVSW